MRLTAARLREVIHYNQRTGIFTWRWYSLGRRLNLIAGNIHENRIRIGVDNRSYRAHRLAWLYVTGKWPVDQIDHKDGNGLNNKFKNLREATNKMNLQNLRRAHKDNRVGLLGVWREKGQNKFRAGITVNGKLKHLGRFNAPEEAHAAYVKAKRQLHEGCTI